LRRSIVKRTLKEKTKLLVGRKIVQVRWRAFRRIGRPMATDPVLLLDDGTELRFSVQEADGCYGISINVWPKEKNERQEGESKSGQDS
jgi:hypothetical protein